MNQSLNQNSFDFERLGDQLPRRKRQLTAKIARLLLKCLGWQITGSLPNVSHAVLIGVPHTSNYDGIPGLLTVMAIDVDIKILGKKQLFSVPILAQFLRWVGVIPIDRDKKGSVLQANIQKFADSDAFLLALAPEGTRDYAPTWKTGFYYLAVQAKVPIIPVGLDYATKRVCFMSAFYPTGDYERDLPKLLQAYRGILGKNYHKMSGILQELNASHENKHQ